MCGKGGIVARRSEHIKIMKRWEIKQKIDWCCELERKKEALLQ